MSEPDHSGPNAERIALLDQLLALSHDFADRLTHASPLDVASFNCAHREALRALSAAGPVVVDAVDTPAVEERLRAVGEITEALSEMLGGLTADAQGRLGTLRARRRGVAGYRDSLAGQRGRGARLGKG